ncbi:putative phiE125 gp8 family phage protein [Rhizomicrobium palustre]|uniref:Putative phiE125 gp8 family phage protein n=1 Tax=Rhizomicrobium palustre TaxID=189966 RepID=A0A846MWN6_9PROT|nr:head-tail connector protein [Rhizomicrobium palustre]NIK87635.1 putative phiE125 gp8 family phage protein [Rhizomicrobium palustre]
MSLSLSSPPVGEPVTLVEAKAHLKLDTSDDDALLGTLITAARARAEWHTGRAFLSQSWVLRLDNWPEMVEIPLPPLQSVQSLACITADGIRTLCDPASYRVDTASVPGRVFLPKKPNNLRKQDCLELAFAAGYGDTVPAALKEAILQIVTDLYTHRGDEGALVSPAGQVLLAPYRIFKL